MESEVICLASVIPTIEHLSTDKAKMKTRKQKVLRIIMFDHKAN